MLGGMREAAFSCSVRERRAALGLSQAELAAQAQVSRQAIVAIEGGRQVPSTLLALELAQILDCRVEDLFTTTSRKRLPATIVDDDERSQCSRFHLGRVDGTWVAHPVTESSLPGDAVRAGGPSDKGASPLTVVSDSEIANNVLVAGCAPLLGLLCGRFNQKGDGSRATWLKTHSMRSLHLLENNQVHVAGIHLVEGCAPGGHAALIQERFSERRMCLFNLTRWRQGLLVAPGNPLSIRTVADILDRKARLVCRDAGSAAQGLLERLWGQESVGAFPQLSGPVAASHEEVARLIQMGVADVGVAIEAVALAARLEFVPLTEEYFDLVVPEARLEHPFVARFFESMSKPSFRCDAGGIPGYDLSSSGQVSTVAH